MIRVDTRALLALYDRRLDLASGINAAHAEDAAVGGVNAVARVEGLLADGQFRATVANQVLNLSLPPGTRIGDQVPVRLVDGNWVAAATTTVPARPLAPAPATAPGTALAGNDEASATRLSPTVRLLAELLQQPAAAAVRPPLGSATALLAQPPQEAGALAQAIRGAIGQSGLFYEAHQAQWLVGARSLGELRAEPQGRLAPLPPTAPLASTPAPVAPPTPAAAGGLSATEAGPQAPAANESPQSPPVRIDAAGEYRSIAAIGIDEAAATTVLVDMNEPPTEALAKASGPAPSPNGPNIHPDALPLVRQQLDVLEQPVLAWRGDFWPGQQGEIELREDREHTPEPGAERVFATRLTLELPRLGPVEAVLQIAGKRLNVRVRGEQSEGAAAMGEHLAELRTALGALGLELDELRVSHGPA